VTKADYFFPTTGAVNVIYGSNNGLHQWLGRNNQLWTQDSPGILDTTEAEDRFGVRLAVGDFNNDNYDDLAISASGETVSGDAFAGAVNVIYGSANGLHPWLGRANQFWTQDSPGILDTADPVESFGIALTAGDFNNDGYDDLAIGVAEDIPGENNAGAVTVIYGSVNGLHPWLGRNNEFWTQDSPGILDTAEGADNFGVASLTAGDFNNDNYDDLAIGIMGEDVAVGGQGAVNVIYGSANGLHQWLGRANEFWHQDSPGILDTAELNDGFGRSLTAGNFNNDLYDDLAIGVRDENGNEGAVHVIYGSANGLHQWLGRVNELWSQDSPGILDMAEADDLFYVLP